MPGSFSLIFNRGFVGVGLGLGGEGESDESYVKKSK